MLLPIGRLNFGGMVSLRLGLLFVILIRWVGCSVLRVGLRLAGGNLVLILLVIYDCQGLGVEAWSVTSL